MPLAETFEELRIWQQSRSLIKRVYFVFSSSNDGCRDFAFRDQIQRASISAMNNIAEGFERSSKADFARFLDMAKGSCGEVRSMLYIAKDLGYIPDQTFKELLNDSSNLSKGIAALTRSLRK